MATGVGGCHTVPGLDTTPFWRLSSRPVRRWLCVPGRNAINSPWGRSPRAYLQKTDRKVPPPRPYQP